MIFEKDRRWREIGTFFLGVMCGSFGGILILLFFQGAYRDDSEWKNGWDNRNDEDK